MSTMGGSNAGIINSLRKKKYYSLLFTQREIYFVETLSSGIWEKRKIKGMVCYLNGLIHYLVTSFTSME
jgi:hypothetical protein